MNDFWFSVDTRVFMSVAVDLIFSDLKEPVRIVKEAKVRVFPSNEKFWNPAKPRMHEEYTLELKEVGLRLLTNKKNIHLIEMSLKLQGKPK